MTNAWHHVAVSKLHTGFAALITVLTLASGCGSNRPGDATPAPTTKATPTTAIGKFEDEAQKLVNAEAKWQTPKELAVGNTERIGLSIGEGTEVKRKIDKLIPSAFAINAGPVQVGQTVKASLFASSEDADISPSEAINASTVTDVQMLWTWLVKPKRPLDKLHLTAHLEVPLSDGRVVTNELSLTLPVKRTMAYTVGEVATHWATWSGIIGSIVGVSGWVLAGRRRRPSEAPITTASE